MKLKLLLETVVHLKPTQVYHQVKYRLKKPAYVAYDSSKFQVSGFKTEPIPKYKSVEGNTFTFLNLEHEFAGWDFTENGMLWAYNQNYFDWLNQEGFTAEEGCKWIDKFIAEVKGGFPMDPYPIALRSINWVKFFCRYPESATKSRLDSLYSQIKLLEKKLEYHLLGNHLLEDAYALYICACYFGDKKLLKKASKLLKGQLEEQILPDGAHYEQSPMYHCILLDRLLDCINICQGSRGGSRESRVGSRESGVKGQEDVRCLSGYAVRMLGHLESVKWSAGGIPLLNDSANGIAPTTSQLFLYAKRLGLKWTKIPMKECGYRKMMAGAYEAIVDVGNITATYQPGHTHADTFNYELRIDGKPVVVDCGISTYNKNERRQYERGTTAHNCVSPNEMNSYEVWGGFRVGNRGKVRCLKEDGRCLEAEHDGFGKPCKRIFGMSENGFTVEDYFDGEAVSYIHIAEDCDWFKIQGSRFKVEGAIEIEERPWKYSTEYNKFKDGKEIKIIFNNYLKYTIL